VKICEDFRQEVEMTTEQRALTKQQTERAAERALEAELNRRGISTARTDTNEPEIDLVALHAKRIVPIQVKGLQKRNDWLLPRPKRKDTVYVFVRVPTGTYDKPGAFRFFIMTAQEVEKEMVRYHAHLNKRPTWKPSLPSRYVEFYENHWSKLEEA
jgi:hypothetical protein